MKKFLKVVLIILIVIIAIGAGGYIYITSGLKSGSKLEMSGIDPSIIADGTYVGTYKAGRWTNTMFVDVKDGEIFNIKVSDDVTFAQEGLSDKIIDSVIAAQNTTVDAVSGATVTSKAYLKAIETALND